MFRLQSYHYPFVWHLQVSVINIPPATKQSTVRGHDEQTQELLNTELIGSDQLLLTPPGQQPEVDMATSRMRALSVKGFTMFSFH